MDIAILETSRRRAIQEKYNKEHNIIPKTIIKEIRDSVTVKISDNVKEEIYKGTLSKAEKIELIAKLEEEMKMYAKE